MSGKTAKEQLLDNVIEHFTRHGLGDISLRQVAAAIGSSHRMLIYHFGSKNGLLVAVARAVEARTREDFSQLKSGTDRDNEEIIRHMWDYVADPALGDFERLFFALFGRGLQGDDEIRPLMGSNTESWLEASTASTHAPGLPPDVARAHARLGLAVVRGLLMDLLATGDRAGTDASLALFAQHYRGQWWVSVPAS
jgi:AcrR family transcriptional regulator